MAFLKRIIVWILTIESRLILRKYKPFIVAVTGSVGKTSTKDAIYDVLKNPGLCKPGEADKERGICFVRKSEKSMNSDIGLPITVIGVGNAWHSVSGWLHNIQAGLKLIFSDQEYPDCLVLEIGADHPGDISNIARWLKPDIAVITKVSSTPVHVEFFNSPEEVFEEKSSLAESVKQGGTVILFADDPKVMSIAGRVINKAAPVIFFGLSEKATVRGSGYKVEYDRHVERQMDKRDDPVLNAKYSALNSPVGISFKLSMDGEEALVKLDGVIGQTYLYPALAAAAVGKARGLSPQVIARSLSSYDAPKGRMRIVSGINDSTLIDDTYNSSPDAALAALETLKDLECRGSRIAILGDMMELGKYAADEHRKVGKSAARIVSRLITVGSRSQSTADEARANGLSPDKIKILDSAEQALEYVKPLVKPGDIVLIKGSQSVRMEKVTKALLREPSKAADLLVRQEKEWLEKK